nr:PREDICTED: uncharacterized protein LOC109041251 isoform X1 [Bemisia tabaci]
MNQMHPLVLANFDLHQPTFYPAEPLREKDVLRTLREDHLTNWSWLDEKEPPGPNTVAIRRGDDPQTRSWIVFRTTKRGTTLYKETFTNEDAAMSFFLDRVRLISICVEPVTPHIVDSDEIYDIFDQQRAQQAKNE